MPRQSLADLVRHFDLQTFTFDDDSDIDVVLGTETITLHYEEDLDDLATVSTDRTPGCR